VGWHGMIGKDAPDDLRQPTSLFGDWLVHPLSQALLDFFELYPRAITSAPPMKEEVTPPRLTAYEGESQEPKGLRLCEPSRARLSAAWRPNSISRVLSECSDSENSSNRLRNASQKRWASASCSKPTTKSSAYLTMTISPVASRCRQRLAQRSST